MVQQKEQNLEADCLCTSGSTKVKTKECGLWIFPIMLGFHHSLWTILSSKEMYQVQYSGILSQCHVEILDGSFSLLFRVALKSTCQNFGQGLTTCYCVALGRRRKQQPTPVFLPGESCGQRSLVGCCLWDHTESDMTEVTQQQQQQQPWASHLASVILSLKWRQQHFCEV